MISIIVPVYNIENYLKPCIDSILNSTFRDYEVILVDDGSTDGSGVLCDRFAAQDSRVRVIHKTNGGLSDARNKGLEVSTGEYILFIDGDDVIHPNMIQVLFDAILSGYYDFSMVYGLPIGEKEYEPMLEDKDLGLNSGIKVITSDDYISGLMAPSPGYFQYYFAWNKLYRRDFIGEDRFVDTAIEDMEFNFRLAQRIKKAALVEENLYYWVQRLTSLTHGGLNRRYVNRMESFRMCFDSIPEDKRDVRSRLLERLYKVMLYTKHYTRQTGLHDEAKRLSKRLYQETRYDFWRSNLPWFKKQSLAFMLVIPMSYEMLIKVCEVHARWK